jgi:uncharacterized protein (DUF433 family)
MGTIAYLKPYELQSLNDLKQSLNLTDYPHLTREDSRAAVAYGAEMSRERYVDIPAEAMG